MKNNEGMYQNYNVEGSAEIKVTLDNSGFDNTMCMSQMNPLVYECPEERCVHKQIIHEVNHIKPINTRIINHHIYRHTYTPCYTCTEENEVCNVNACGPMFM